MIWRVLLVALWALVLAGPARPAAWPRPEGGLFLALSQSVWTDPWQALDLYERTGLILPEIETEQALYLEYGLGPRMTVGVDHFATPGGDQGQTLVFLRIHPGGEVPLGLGFGMGQDRAAGGLSRGVTQVQAALGRGVETRWGAGWLEVHGKAAHHGPTQYERAFGAWSLDGTAGLNLPERRLVYLQTQLSGTSLSPRTILRLVPTYVHPLPHGLSLESGLIWGVEQDDRLGAKMGLWLEF